MLQWLKKQFRREKRWTDVKTIRDLFAIPDSVVGYTITQDAALNISAVFAAIDAKSNDFACLPCYLYVADPEDDDQEATDHPVNKLLQKPNDKTTNYLFRKALMAQTHLSGNGYALIYRDGAGRAVSMENLDSGRVTMKFAEDGTFWYVVDTDENVVQPEDMLHIRYFSLDGITGISPLQYAKTSLGAAYAADRMAAAFFGNSGRPSGLLSFPNDLNPEQSAALGDAWRRAHGGDKTGNTAVIGNSGTYTPMQMSFEDMQFISLRQFSVIEVCRWYNIPPHRCRELGRSTWNNISSENLSYVRDSLRPLTIQFEQEALKLLSPSEREQYELEHDYTELLKADHQTRFACWQIGLQNRFLTVNEVREFECLPPIEGGDEITSPQPTPPPSDPNTNTDQPSQDAAQADGEADTSQANPQAENNH